MYSWVGLGEHLAGLLCDSDEGGPATELLQFGCAYVSAGGAHTTQDISDGVLHIALIGHLHRPALRCPAHTVRMPSDKIQSNIPS